MSPVGLPPGPERPPLHPADPFSLLEIHWIPAHYDGTSGDTNPYTLLFVVYDCSTVLLGKNWSDTACSRLRSSRPHALPLQDLEYLVLDPEELPWSMLKSPNSPHASQCYSTLWSVDNASVVVDTQGMAECSPISYQMPPNIDACLEIVRPMLSDVWGSPEGYYEVYHHGQWGVVGHPVLSYVPTGHFQSAWYQRLLNCLFINSVLYTSLTE